ncbi:MAG: glycosyltransferase [Pirellulaceae bacterium]|nr:glycosyltransferase [Pirellulaceae bacterium]
MSHSICIIVPCYNEAKRLNVPAFCRFAAKHPRVRFVMVNDGSRDDTLDVIRRMSQQIDCPMSVVDLPMNQGKAEAVRQGMNEGLTFAPDYLGYWDADLATPLDAISELAAILDQRDDLDLVLASRMSLLGRKIDRHWLRKKIGRVCGGMASLVLGTRIRDTQCGAKLFRVTPITSFVFSSPLTSRWLFDVELFARLIQTWDAVDERPFAERVFEYPLHHWTEIPGSSLKKMDFLKAGWELTQIYMRYLRPFASAPDVSQIETTLPPVRHTIPLRKKAA